MSETKPAAAPDRRKLARAVLLRFGVGVPALGLLVFLPAGSLAYPNGWLFMGLLLALMAVALAYLFAKDPALLEKRLKTREREAGQRRVIALSSAFLLPLFGLPGLDWRLGWSKVPAWLVGAAALVLAAGYLLFLLVMRANSYASRVVEVQEGQKVIDTGPYAFVRHPLYLSSILIYLSSPLVLGSWWALIPALAFLPVLASRIKGEEELLRRELPGYEDYARRVRWRLFPGLY